MIKRKISHWVHGCHRYQRSPKNKLLWISLANLETCLLCRIISRDCDSFGILWIYINNHVALSDTMVIKIQVPLLSQVTATRIKIGHVGFIYGVRFSNELQRLDNVAGYHDCSTRNGRQATNSKTFRHHYFCSIYYGNYYAATIVSHLPGAPFTKIDWTPIITCIKSGMKSFIHSKT